LNSFNLFSDVKDPFRTRIDPVWIGPALAVHADKLPEHSEMEEAPAPNTSPTLRP
jgi:hypothetical protein